MNIREVAPILKSENQKTTAQRHNDLKEQWKLEPVKNKQKTGSKSDICVMTCCDVLMLRNVTSDLCGAVADGLWSHESCEETADRSCERSLHHN